ncbi:hypothetical protein RHSIM_Rhsim04G0239200 [Rhododendron simsii]|uniref:Uncharacterized protein n=1 Tax=Rhododendron simsii TaxID=118357 RepID=A0A834LRR9_RHOSS|nr:hypothetical protein RHSIM_Rhsim04G0239200 [Rhododendron simsii]
MDAPPPPPAEELLKKIQELEAGHAHLKHEMSKLLISTDQQKSAPAHQQRSHSVSPQRLRRRVGGGEGATAVLKKGSASFRNSSPLQRESRSGVALSSGGGGGGGCGPAAVGFNDRQYLNILQSMGQSVHIFDLNLRIIYWNHTAEQLYGHSTAEALGQDAIELLTDVRDYAVVNDIIQRVTMGESWAGQLPVMNKRGDRFVVLATYSPFYDDDGALVGIICVSSDSRPFQDRRDDFPGTQHTEGGLSFSRPRSIASAKLGLDPQQPLQVAIASKISNLASKVSNKVKSKMRTGESNMDREGGSGDGHYSDHGFSDAALSDHREDANSSGASTPRGDIPPSPFGGLSQVAHDEHSPGKLSRDSGDESEGKPGIHKIISSKAEAWIGKKGLSWPWKGNEHEGVEAKNIRFVWPWSNNDHENDFGHLKSSFSGVKQDSQVGESNRPTHNEASGSWSSSFNVNSTSSASSCGSTSSSAVNRVDMDTDSLDYEILWEDLTIGEQIGQGSCGTVYHALWFGSDVAVKVFSRQEYSEDVIYSFRQEWLPAMTYFIIPSLCVLLDSMYNYFECKLSYIAVPLLYSLVLTDVTSPQRLCIVTEFLPRCVAYYALDLYVFTNWCVALLSAYCLRVFFFPSGSLFRLLQRNTSKLDWRRRVHMALDIVTIMNHNTFCSNYLQVRGMNYLHHCNPPIIHRDLKSSNLLVDKNWTVKVSPFTSYSFPTNNCSQVFSTQVGDFGLSRLKHETFLTTKTGKGTPQWMAPEVLRNEQADEKSDIYSFGVILWELATEKIPWDNLNSMQVIGAVGFMNQRLEIPADVDPQWASIIESCWHSEPQSRPTFQELLDRFKDLQKQYAVQFLAARSAAGDS